MNPDESAFLATIAARPQEEIHRLVFADWLEERGDPRAAWVRDAEVWKWMEPDAADPRPKLASALGKGGPVRDVITALERVGVPAVPLLVHGLRGDERLARLSAKTLGGIGPAASAAVTDLIEALRSRSHDVRRCAAEALGKIGPAAAAAVPALLVSLKDVNSRVQRDAAEALSKIGPAAAAAVPLLIDRLKDGKEHRRQTVATALRNFGAEGPTVIDALVNALQDKRESVRIRAASSLGHIGQPAARAIPALIVARDRAPELRVRAAEALGMIGGPTGEVVTALTQLLTDPVMSVQVAARESLGRITNPPPADE